MTKPKNAMEWANRNKDALPKDHFYNAVVGSALIACVEALEKVKNSADSQGQIHFDEADETGRMVYAALALAKGTNDER